MKKRNAFELKLFMALLMVLDHLGHIPGLLPPWLVGLFHAATRCVGAWFAYAAVEGLLHTRSRPRYILRLFGWAAFMAAGNWVYNQIAMPQGLHLSNNIFLTLGLGALCLALLDWRLARRIPCGSGRRGCLRRLRRRSAASCLPRAASCCCP